MVVINMSTNVPSSIHVCATCGNWTGVRFPAFIGAYSEVNPSEKGKCMSKDGFYLIDTPAMTACCRGWVLWPVMQGK